MTQSKGNQLHQLLAVEGDKKKLLRNILDETVDTFKNKQGHFDGETRKYTKLDEDSDDLPSETKEVVTTVADKLDYNNDVFVDVLNTLLMKEETNAGGTAVAELKVDDVVFGTFSATALLQMESQLKSLRDVYHRIPTLDPLKKWKVNNSSGLWEAGPETTFRSIQVPTVLVKYEATDKHPAQTEIVPINKQVGKWEKEYQSGRITPKQKSELLGRIDKLLNAVKKARSIANNAEVVKINAAKKFVDFINEPLKK
jgi:hypothetical protein